MADTSQFGVPVDTENKSKVLRIWSVQYPHHRAFHLNWMSFFIAFTSTFAPAALGPIIRDAINLQKADLGNAGIAAVSGTIFARICMGSVCDVFGPRYGHSVLMLGTAPAVVCMALVTDATGFLLCRLCIGFSLATFVACQFWCSVMFNVKIVGVANATAGGWGNLGGGVTQLLMPLLFSAFKTSAEPFIAWRLAFFVPYALHIVVAMLILFFTQDLPDGNYSELRKRGHLNKAQGGNAFLLGVRNYRMWCLVITYGYCFGVELTMNNVIVTYMFDQFEVSLTIAGLLGSMFGLMNIAARSLGGLASDLSSKKYGMRGRLWCLWLLQTAEGGFCILMGLARDSLAGTMVVMVFFSLSVQAAEGASFGVVPFVSKRALGIVSGFVGAGGNAGSAVTQAIFFADSPLETYEGISYMGIMIIAMTLFVIPIYFPMWGGMFCAPKAGVTEEDYYGGEFTEEEIAQGLAAVSLRFAAESKSERGAKGLAALEESGVKEPKTAA